jgi:hypothetical protein
VGEGEMGRPYPIGWAEIPSQAETECPNVGSRTVGRCRRGGVRPKVHGRVPRCRDPEGGIVTGTSEGRICKAKTGNGRQCRNPVLPGSQFCGRHERSDKVSPWWWTNAPELLRSWDEESLEVDERQRLELKRLFGPPRSRNSRTRRSGTGRRSTRRPSALYRGPGNVDDG